MARSIPVRLDSFEWPSTAAAEDAFRRILKESGYGLYERITNPVHDQMLREVLDRHKERDEKIGKGVDFFYIGRTIDDPNRRFKISSNATGIWIQRVDGTKVEFSYRTALGSHTPESNVKDSLRIAVDGERLKYRDSRFAAESPVVSDLSGVPIYDRDQAAVVYLNPTWGQLTFRFVVSEGGWSKLEVHSGYGDVQVGGRLVDAAIEARWLLFHKKHARLGIATASEAASRPRVADDAWEPPPGARNPAPAQWAKPLVDTDCRSLLHSK